MALVLPLLMALVLGTIGFGRVFHTKLELSNAAQEGARYAVFAPRVPSPPSVAQVKTVMVDASTLAPALTTGAVTVTGSCTTLGSTVTVQGTRVVAFNFVLGTYSQTVTGKAAMRCPG